MFQAIHQKNLNALQWTQALPSNATTYYFVTSLYLVNPLKKVSKIILTLISVFAKPIMEANVVMDQVIIFHSIHTGSFKYIQFYTEY